MSAFADTIYKQKYALRNDKDEIIEEWADTALRVTTHVMKALGYEPGDREFDMIYRFIRERKFIPGGRYLYASGRGLHQTQNCLLLRAEDSREGWADLMHKAGMALMTGAGIGIDYSQVRPSGALIKKTGGVASGPIALMKIINEIGRGVMQGGSRRSAIWAGLSWKHGDIFDFIRIKDWSENERKLKDEDFNFKLEMEYTNISVILDDEFFEAFEQEDHELHGWAQDVYWKTLDKMLTTAEPGFSVDVGDNAGESLRNACTEVTSADDSDICNLGSINLATNL
jgi:ribonucleoside-diphosphate reductase alpha chain